MQVSFFIGVVVNNQVKPLFMLDELWLGIKDKMQSSDR